MSRENVQLAKAAYEAFNCGDIDSALARMDPDIEWHTWSHFAPSQVFRGHDGVRQVLQTFFDSLENFRAEPKDFVDAGGRIMVPVCLSGRSRSDGEQVRYDLVQVWTTRDRLAIRLDVYDSRSDALKALAREQRAEASGPPPDADTA